MISRNWIFFKRKFFFCKTDKSALYEFVWTGITNTWIPLIPEFPALIFANEVNVLIIFFKYKKNYKIFSMNNSRFKYKNRGDTIN